MKKTLVLVGILAVSAGAFAGPHRGGFRGGHHGFHHAPVMHHHYHHGGSRHFWSGVAGAVVGGLVYDAVTAPYRSTVVVSPTVVAPAVVTQPVVVQPTVVQPVTTVQNVWVEGRYVDQVQANGSVVRIWQPGHYEQQTVTVQ